MFKETKEFRKRPNFTRLHILLLFIAIGFISVDIAEAGQGKSAIAQRAAKRNFRRSSNTSQSFAAPTVASAVSKSDPIRRRRPSKTNQKQSRSFRQKFSEVEIVLSNDFTLADASSLPAAPGSNLTVLNDPMRVGMQLPISEIKTLVEEGIEVTMLRNFVLVEGFADKTNAMANKVTTAASSSSAYIYDDNSQTIDIPSNGGWVNRIIDFRGASTGETVTSVDVYYGIESSLAGYVYADLSDENPNFFYTLLDGENGYFAETITGITKFNGRAVDQQWVLWASDVSFYDDFGYIESWWIKVYYGESTPLSDIHGYKFDDADGDGVWDQSEVGLAGWTIYLDTNTNGQYDAPEPSVITDPNGHYEFLDLDPDTYTVAEVMQAGWTQTLPGGNGTYPIIAEPNQVYSGKNFGNTTLQIGYCDASGGGDYEYISRVQIGTIDNSSADSDYHDYTAISTEMVIGGGHPITVTNGSPWSSDKCGIWVDWNQDMDFDDAGEAITVSGNPSRGPYTATIAPPAGASLGDTRMRIRIIDSAFPPYSLDPCGSSQYGEVEDYTVTVISAPATVKISGYVRTGGSVAIPGVSMSATTGESDTTDASGYYELTFSSNPWTGSITPSKSLWAFSPPYISFNGITSDLPNRNFTGTASITTQAIEDVYVDSANPDTNYGSTSYLFSGRNGDAIRRTFLKFDLSSIPPGNIVTSATLRCYNSFVSTPMPELYAFEVSDRWEESTVTWNDQPNTITFPYTPLPIIGSIVSSITTWNVTENVDDEYIGDGFYSVTIVTSNESGLERANFTSKESSIPNTSPELVIEYEPIFGGGSGEVDSPYQIWTGEQFNTIGLHPNRWTKNYELMANISMTGYTGNSYNLIGASTSINHTAGGEFRGVFDGNYHTISDFSAYESVFGYLYEGTIKALKLISPDISSGSDTGAIVGSLASGNIFDCQVQGGTVSGSDYVGGIVGYYAGGHIVNCSSSAAVTGDDYVGGFIGKPGIWGGGTISNCYATGSVEGLNYVGGFMGSSSDTAITNCYSAGSVAGTTNVGGFSGYNSNQYTLEDTIYDCFYDSDVNPTLPAIGNVTGPFGVTDESTANMQTQATFTNAGWDFVAETANGGSDNWAMLPTGYPVLWYELSVTPALPPFAGGTGTAVDPYLIETEVQLNSIGHNSRLMDKHFKLINDLDMDGMKYYMIAPEPYEFSGTFDGNGHTVSNILLESSYDISAYGFVGMLKGTDASIHDLTLVDPVIDSDWAYPVGSLVGMNESGTITNCHAINANIRGLAKIGGLVGINNQYGMISGCSSTGNVSENTFMSVLSAGIGGLVGENSFWSEIENSFAKCSVTGNDFVGGLVGYCVVYSSITNCYAGSEVVGTIDRIGGLVGVIGASSEISYCYSSSVATGPDETESIGGLVGGKISSADNYYTACFWDSEINPGLTGIGGTTDPDVIGETTVNMQTETTFTDAGWDFTTPVWKILEGIDYPKFDWDKSISTTFSLDHTWMYQNLPEGKTGSNLTAAVAIIDDPSSNNSYSYQWEIILPSDVTIEPSTVSGGDSGDESWTFAAPSCNEPTGISDSGQMFTVKVTVTGDDFGNVGSAEMEFAIALLGDINNDRVVSGADRGITNVFWRNGSVGPFTLRDCDLNCDGVVNGADRGITNTIWRGLLGSNSVTVPCPVR